MPADATRPTLSVIVPVYNESHRIAQTVAEINGYARASGIDLEILVVDDGSTDDTARIVRDLASSDCRIRALGYPENRGKGRAVRHGVMASRGVYVMFLDADLAIPISIIQLFLTALDEGYDIAVASRRHPDSVVAIPSLKRRVMGRGFRWLVSTLLVRGVSDTQCGGKAYRAEVARELFARQRIDHFSFDAEVLFLAERAGYRIKETPVEIHHRDGSSIRPVRDAARMTLDLMRIRLFALRGFYR